MSRSKFFSTTLRLFLCNTRVYIPEDFPIVPTRLIIAQWKQACPPWTECTVTNPLLAVRYQNVKLFITQQSNRKKKERTILYETQEEVRGHWLDFRFDIRFALDESGQIDGWLNGKPITNYRGQTAFRGGWICPSISLPLQDRSLPRSHGGKYDHLYRRIPEG